MKILQAGDDAAKEALRVLKNEGTIIYPTDTLYGIGVDATSDKAKEKVYEIKGRDSSKPMSICVADIKQASEFVRVRKETAEIAKKFLPGPLTLVLPQRREMKAMKFVSKDGKIAIRIPDNKFTLSLVKAFGKPITSTSANLSGQKDPAKISDIDSSVREKCDLIIDGGICKYSMLSTIVDVKKRKVLREGAIARETLRKAGLID